MSSAGSGITSWPHVAVAQVREAPSISSFIIIAAASAKHTPAPSPSTSQLARSPPHLSPASARRPTASYPAMDRLSRMLAAAQGMGGMGGGPQADTNLIDNSETVYISSLALLKMLRHGRAGVPMEVMGLMLGEFVDDYTVRVVDVFAMPQSGTGVSVEAVDPVFQTKMMDMLRQTGRQETVVGWYHSHPGFGCWLSSVDINTQQSFEQLTPRAVAVVVDPIQSVKGKVVIDAFRLINPQTLMMGHEPRQTTSNVGHLNKPSIQALIHGLNRHYYSIGINYRKTALEENMLMNLHKHVWTEALLMDDFKGEGDRNTDRLQKLVTLADGYEKRVKEETELTKDQLKTRYVGKVDPKKHISDVGQQLIEDNIVSVSRQMIDKEASVPKPNARQNGQSSGGDDVEMEE
ncbi:26s proteasome regulatory subunit rpn11 [Stemphylium lycopersici]|nr:26s proteasome regulatory subunit rpn11 [Stemphylium lycopersici]